MWPTSPAVPFACRWARPMPPSPPITSTARNCSSSTASTASKLDADPYRLGDRIYPRALCAASNDGDDLNEEEGLLLRAADLIGQLGDPNYMRNPTRCSTIRGIGLNKTLGYETPADVVYKFPQFYWNNVAPQIQTAIRYLNVTSSGRRWIANLYSNVFSRRARGEPVGPAAVITRPWRA